MRGSSVLGLERFLLPATENQVMQQSLHIFKEMVVDIRVELIFHISLTLFRCRNHGPLLRACKVVLILCKLTVKICAIPKFVQYLLLPLIQNQMPIPN